MRGEMRVASGKWQLRLLILCLLLLLGDGAVSAVFAQNGVPVSAELSDTTVTTDDRVVLTITVQGQPDSPPSLATLQGMRIVGTSSSSQTTIVNSTITSQAVFFYTLRPIEQGTLTIEPIQIMIDGVPYQTEALTLFVEEGIVPIQPDVDGSVVPPGELIDQDFYVEAMVDNDQPYIGQQIAYIFRFYQALELRSRPKYTSPEFIGFWNQQETQQTQTLSLINGKTYRITELKSPLFPSLAGQRTIEASELELPSGQILLTEPATINVRDLPQPAPADFSGATGQYRISADIETTELNVNDPLTLRIQLSGIGNIETLPDPTWPEIDGWRAFENQSAVSTQFENGLISGSRTYERIYLPSRPGEVIFPSIGYTYFNPETETYEVTETDAFTLRVLGSVGDSAELDVNNSAEPETVAAETILAMKQAPRTLSRARTALLNQMWFWALWVVPLLVLVGDLTRRWAQRKRTNVDPNVRRKNQALKTAKQALSAARNQPERVNIGAILATYFSDKWLEPFGGLTRELREQRLLQHGLSPDLIAQISTIFQRSEAIIYSGDSAETYTNLIDEAERMLTVINKEVGR